VSFAQKINGRTESIVAHLRFIIAQVQGDFYGNVGTYKEGQRSSDMRLIE